MKISSKKIQRLLPQELQDRVRMRNLVPIEFCERIPARYQTLSPDEKRALFTGKNNLLYLALTQGDVDESRRVLDNLFHALMELDDNAVTMDAVFYGKIKKGLV